MGRLGSPHLPLSMHSTHDHLPVTALQVPTNRPQLRRCLRANLLGQLLCWLEGLQDSVLKPGNARNGTQEATLSVGIRIRVVIRLIADCVRSGPRGSLVRLIPVSRPGNIRAHSLELLGIRRTKRSTAGSGYEYVSFLISKHTDYYTGWKQP